MKNQIEIEYTASDGSLVELLIPVERCVPLTGAAKGGVAWYGDSRSSLSPEDHRALIADQIATLRATNAQIKEEMIDFLLEHADPEWLDQLADEIIPLPMGELNSLDVTTDWDAES